MDIDKSFSPGQLFDVSPHPLFGALGDGDTK